MEIKRYEDWMRDQVIDLFVGEYGVDKVEFGLLFGRFYEHPFQVNSCVRIVAEEFGKVAGFQSFFSWPLKSGNHTMHALQSGNSLVHPEFRGQKLFARMLDFIHEPAQQFDFDILIGFPVEASFNSFVRNKWKNPFDLQWHVRPLTPLLSLFGGGEARVTRISQTQSEQYVEPDAQYIGVDMGSEFTAYRRQFQTGLYHRFSYTRDGMRAQFELKIQVRKKLIRELVIGSVQFNHQDRGWMIDAFGMLIRDLRKSAGGTFLSIAVNPLQPLWKEVLIANGFRTIDKKIHFIAKGPLAEATDDWSNWNMFRGAIDTW